MRVHTQQHESRRDERGASSVEYGLLAVLIAAIIVLAVVALGQSTGDAMGSPCDSLAGSGSAASCP